MRTTTTIKLAATTISITILTLMTSFSQASTLNEIDNKNKITNTLASSYTAQNNHNTLNNLIFRSPIKNITLAYYGEEGTNNDRCSPYPACKFNKNQDNKS
jgi:hypothetical protein